MECRRGLAMRILSVRPSVCPSVCLSAKRVPCDKTGEKSVQIFIPCERSFSLVFWEEESLVVGDFFPRCSEIADVEPVLARSASAVRSSEKSSINTNRKSTTRFQMSLRWSSYVASKPPKGGSKTQSVQNLNNKLRTSKWYEVECQCVSINN